MAERRVLHSAAAGISNHVWSYDFVEDRTHNGRKFRMLNVIDEFTRECLAIRIDCKLNSTAVIDVLSDLFVLRGVPGHVPDWPSAAACAAPRYAWALEEAWRR